MERLRRIRIAYVLAALGAIAAAVALIVAVGNDNGSDRPATTPPRQVDIGGKGPRSCVVESVPLAVQRTIAATRSATVTQPVKATVTVQEPDGSKSKASAATTVKESATVTGRAVLKVNVTGRGAVCARASSPEAAQRRAEAAARQRARRQARGLAAAALDRAEAGARPGLERRTLASARASAQREVAAAVPRARAEAERRAAEAAAP